MWHYKQHLAILDEAHQVVFIEDPIEWARFFVDSQKRCVAEIYLSGYRISTVFLGINVGFFGPALWFETMVFPEGNQPPELSGKLAQYLDELQLRYATWAEAEKGHEMVVTMIREGLF